MSSETSNVSATKVEQPAYKVIAEQIAALMLAGKQSGMDQEIIRAAIHTFGQVACQPQPVYRGVEAGNACLSKGY